jgi:hypothetical protein
LTRDLCRVLLHIGSLDYLLKGGFQKNKRRCLLADMDWETVPGEGSRIREMPGLLFSLKAVTRAVSQPGTSDRVTDEKVTVHLSPPLANNLSLTQR